jgi:hypothetical protein
MPNNLPDPVKVPQGPHLMAASTSEKVRNAHALVDRFQARSTETSSRGQSAYRTDASRNQIVVYFRYLSDGPIQLELPAPLPLHQIVGRFVGWGVAHGALCAVGSFRNRQAMWITNRDESVPAGHYVLFPALSSRFRSGWCLQVHSLSLSHSFVFPGYSQPRYTAAWSSKSSDPSASTIVETKRLVEAYAHMQFIVAARYILT